MVAAPDLARDGKAACQVCGAPVNSPGLDVCGTHLPDALGITYRQLDYWTRIGLLHPGRRDPARHGSGTARTWTAAELEVARAMGKLTAAGLPPRAAEQVARAGSPCEIAPGVLVQLLPPQ